MKRYFHQLLSGLLLLVTAASVQAFSLIGPYATWQTVTLGYQWGGDIGGPMNINEGYRWTVPIITYAYDATFLKYYGADGVTAMEAAIKVFNDLPDADSMTPDLSEFALQQFRYNPTAGNLGIRDIKTEAMGFILEHFYGAAGAERYTFTLRSEAVPPPGAPQQDFSVVQRNFDPITWNPSAYVNNVLYTYEIFQVTTTPSWQTIISAADVLAPELTTLIGFTRNEGAVSLRAGLLFGAPGGYFSGLTRDDAGLVRFNLRKSNVNVETPFADVVGGTQTSAQSSGSSSSPWSLVTTITNLNSLNFLTNALAIVKTAPRPGVGKYKFVRVEFDSLIGATLSPYAINWQDKYVTNNAIKSQTVSRLVTEPDLLFSSGDLGVVTPIGAPVIVAYTGTGTWANNSALNTDQTLGEHDGPGTTDGRHELSFGTFVRYYLNFAPFGDGVGQVDATVGETLGYFDGSTNAPIVFPTGSSILKIENLALGGN